MHRKTLFLQFLVPVVAFGVPGLVCTGTHAALITGYTVSGNGNGTASVLILGNSIVVTGKNFTGLGPIDITFATTNSGATNTYTVAEGVTNSTGVTWTDYEEELGSGAGNTFAIANTPVNFAAPNSNSAFATMSLAAHSIDMYQGSVTNGNTVSVSFDLTVPDQNPAGNVSTFTLRQFPTVPEPASIGLLCLGGLGMLARRRCRV